MSLPSQQVTTGRDAGLIRSVGLLAFLTTIINCVIGAGIYRLPAEMAHLSGAYSPFAYVACAIAMGAVALCYGEAGSRVPTSGGPYGFIDAALGGSMGFVSGVMVWLAGALAAGGISVAFAETMGVLVPGLSSPLWRNIIVILVHVVFTVVNLASVATATRIISWATLVKLMPLIVFLAAGAFAVQSENFTLPDHFDAGAFGRASVLGLFAFTGMETALGASGEVRDPARTVPRALMWAMGIVAVSYVAIQVVAQGVLGGALGASPAPIADGLATVSPTLRNLVLVGMLVSMLGWLTGNALGSPRVLFAFARDGLLPAAMGKVHPKTHVPYVAILVNSMITMSLALSGTFQKLVVLSTLAAAIVYFMGCVACLVLRKRDVKQAGEPLKLAVTPFVAVIGMLGMAAIVSQSTADEIIASVATIVVCLAYYAVYRKLRGVRAGVQATPQPQ